MFVFSIAYNKIKKQKKKERTFPHFASINRGQFNREIYGIRVSVVFSIATNICRTQRYRLEDSFDTFR